MTKIANPDSDLQLLPIHRFIRAIQDTYHPVRQCKCLGLTRRWYNERIRIRIISSYQLNLLYSCLGGQIEVLKETRYGNPFSTWIFSPKKLCHNFDSQIRIQWSLPINSACLLDGWLKTSKEPGSAIFLMLPLLHPKNLFFVDFYNPDPMIVVLNYGH